MKKPTFSLKGSMTALVTPMKDGQVDLTAFARFVEWQIESGTAALVPAGTTGENATLSHEEQLGVIEACVKAARGRVPVIAGTGKNDTAATIELTREALARGADAALVVTPYYNKPTQEGLFRHYAAVADAVEIPLVLYNVPGRTGISLTPETVARLHAERRDRIVAIKEASGDLVLCAEILRLCPGLIVLSGEDALTFPMIALGASGVISVTSNVVPGEFSRLVAASLSGDLPSARSLHLKLLPLMRALFVESSPGPVKYALSRLGRCSAEMRLPMAPIAAASATRVDSVLKDLALT